MVGRHCVLGVIALLLASCMNARRANPPLDPDASRANILRLIPAHVSHPDGWAVDIFAALDALDLPATPDRICAVVAVIEQESGFQVDPMVPGLPALARREIESRAASHGIPGFVLKAAMALQSPNGLSYSQRVNAARTEKDLSDLYEDFIGTVPLGQRLFADWNPIRTAGPMQVSIEYAEKQIKARHYPYSMASSVRAEVFSRRGGLYFGVAHLFDYPVAYDAMLFRFADFNAGHYASRNAAFQKATSLVSHSTLTLDGDLLRHGGDADQPSQTELTLRKLAGRMKMSEVQIHHDLLEEEQADFAGTPLYGRIFMLADASSARPVARALVPQIRLQGPMISRPLTTDWYAHRVDQRFQRCLSRATAAAPAPSSLE